MREHFHRLERRHAEDDKDERDESEGELLDSNRASAYRSNVARMSYLDIDRPDIACDVRVGQKDAHAEHRG